MNVNERYSESIHILDLMCETRKNLKTSKIDDESKKFILLQLSILAQSLNIFNQTIDSLENEIASLSEKNSKLKQKIEVLEIDSEYNGNETQLAIDKICLLRDEVSHFKVSSENQDALVREKLKNLKYKIRAINDLIANFILDEDDDEGEVFKARL